MHYVRFSPISSTVVAICANPPACRSRAVVAMSSDAVRVTIPRPATSAVRSNVRVASSATVDVVSEVARHARGGLDAHVGLDAADHELADLLSAEPRLQIGVAIERGVDVLGHEQRRARPRRRHPPARCPRCRGATANAATSNRGAPRRSAHQRPTTRRSATRRCARSRGSSWRPRSPGRRRHAACRSR